MCLRGADIVLCCTVLNCIVLYCIVLYCFVLYCVVLYSIVFYGMVWYGMVWYGMVWYGMVWYGMVWYGMVSCSCTVEFHSMPMSCSTPPSYYLIERFFLDNVKLHICMYFPAVPLFSTFFLSPFLLILVLQLSARSPSRSSQHFI